MGNHPDQSDTTAITVKFVHGWWYGVDSLHGNRVATAVQCAITMLRWGLIMLLPLQDCNRSSPALSSVMWGTPSWRGATGVMLLGAAPEPWPVLSPRRMLRVSQGDLIDFSII